MAVLRSHKARIEPLRTRKVSGTRTIDELAPEDAVLREFIADFSAASALMRRLRRVLSDSLDLSASEQAVMLGLWYCERRGEPSVRELADHLHVAAANVTAELGKLESMGLVVKTPSRTDRRSLNVRLTQQGHDLLNDLAPILREVNLSLFAGVNYSDMVVVHRFFKQLIEQAPKAIRVAEMRKGGEKPVRKKDKKRGSK